MCCSFAEKREYSRDVRTQQRHANIYWYCADKMCLWMFAYEHSATVIRGVSSMTYLIWRALFYWSGRFWGSFQDFFALRRTEFYKPTSLTLDYNNTTSASVNLTLTIWCVSFLFPFVSSGGERENGELELSNMRSSLWCNNLQFLQFTPTFH